MKSNHQRERRKLAHLDSDGVGPFRPWTCLRSAVLCLGGSLCLTFGTALATESELAELKKAIRQLQLENHELSWRLKALETQRSERQPAPVPVAPDVVDQAEKINRAAEDNEALARRVKELELAKGAQERATRLIIQEAMAKTGSKINDVVTLGGAIDVMAGRRKDFTNPYRNEMKFNTAELDLEIQMSPWATGSFILGYEDGTGGSVFQTNRGVFTGVDRFNLDRAYVTVGDLTRFPLYFRAGRMTLPFGISTGVHRADVLTIDSPLTIDGFETRKTAFGFGFGVPVPPLGKSPAPVVAPRVIPVLISPLISSFAEGVMGYKPIPFRPRAAPLSFPPPKQAPLYGSIYFYDGGEASANKRDFHRNIVGRLGVRSHGNCGQNYDQLRTSRFCPWTFDANLDYNSSVFDSRFLEHEYRAFVSQFDRIGGLGLNAKMTFGPTSMVVEWNGASKAAQFRDDTGRAISIKPAAWQVSLGHQFDWNPWVESIGAQGTFIAFSYSKTQDLAGVTQLVGGVATRVGMLPKSRTTLTVGEWLVDGVKLVVEYSLTRDYSVAEGGAGSLGRGFFTTITFAW